MKLLSADHPSTSFVKRYRFELSLAAVAVLSFFLFFVAIEQNGTANEYYAAAVKSMTMSFKNFFYISFDPAGMVSVDKPPLGLWTQVLSVLIFGYHGWAMILPQALAGTASCVMVYILTAKYFGKPAGLLASVFFSLTPVVVIASRNNTMDMQLVFVLLAATWFVFRSVETGKWRHLFVAGALIGVGFNIKMLQAYMIVPAVVLFYLLFSKEKLGKKLLAGLIGVIIMVGVSLSWAIAVDLTPSDARPYVDSSTNNSVMELIIGHNGLARLFGEGVGNGGVPSGGAPIQSESFLPNGEQFPQNGTQVPFTQDQPVRDERPQNNSLLEQSDGQQQPNTSNKAGGIGGDEIGDPGLLRLWSTNLFGQSSWFIPLIVFAIIAFWSEWRAKAKGRGIFLYWLVWFGAMAVFFSFAEFYHRYYLCMLAPAMAILSAVGIIRMTQYLKENKGWKRFLLSLSLLITLGIQLPYVWAYSQLRSWLIPLMLIPAALSLIFAVLSFIRPVAWKAKISAVLMTIGILAAPTYWSLTAVLYVPNAALPYAGPELSSGVAFNRTGTGSSDGLENYLVKNYKEGSFLVVSQRANDVAQFIIDTGLPVYAYGGFLGSDNSLDLNTLKKLVDDDKITYFLVSSQTAANSEIISYVKNNAALIDPTEYGGNSTGVDRQGTGAALYLFK